MEELNVLTVTFIQICEQIDSLYLQKKDLEKQMKAKYNDLVDECSRTGKTINEV